MFLFSLVLIELQGQSSEDRLTLRLERREEKPIAPFRRCEAIYLLSGETSTRCIVLPVSLGTVPSHLKNSHT